ncbi:glycoside hydrolase family 2 protein [Leifsonia sp. A12D58]|uniref:glycoside hydrolase family 2 protein n=1 Tax=Leifsonia sp. A12D58 TaxID=3397674 RepID=UPI0039DF59A9
MSRRHTTLALEPLLTPWGEVLNVDSPLPEYPRPQLVRDSYQNLNGRWQYAISPADASGIDAAPAVFDGDIVVPFSPESLLSGVQRQVQPTDVLHYSREFVLAGAVMPSADERVLLHFGAVDQRAQVWLNGILLGEHIGGYLPFCFDATDALAVEGIGHGVGSHTLRVVVHDPSDTNELSRGKQKLKRGGIWYTAQSGIWQTVWLERVPVLRIDSLTLVPQLDAGGVQVTVHTTNAVSHPATKHPSIEVRCRIELRAEGELVATVDASTNQSVLLTVPDPQLWTPETPFLYDVTVTMGDDRVESYVGLRSFGMGPDAHGIPRLLLNGKPYFHAGILDQGYWSDGLYTPPSDAAMVHDIQSMKDLGFTMLRKHIKIEPLRWYYHCDRLGILVWQDLVNGGGDYNPIVVTAPVLTPLTLNDNRYGAFARTDAMAREHWKAELVETVELLRNVTSIAVWVPFNEGWGQFDALEATATLRRIDPTRTVDHASGWHDQGGGDLTSLHVYFRRFRVPKRREATAHRALVVSEYGGYSQRLPEHSVSAREFGYKRFATTAALAEAFVRLHEREIIPAIAGGLSATVYTQVSDVEDETNGVLSYDRKVVKIPRDVLRSVNAQLTLGDPVVVRSDAKQGREMNR